jgi:hypothetical protein
MPQARQVSIRLQATALALAPSTVSLTSQDFLPVAKILMQAVNRHRLAIATASQT